MNAAVTGNDIFKEIKHSLSKYHLSFETLYQVSTERASVVVGSRTGLVTKRAK
jgi:hypothetical protein